MKIYLAERIEGMDDLIPIGVYSTLKLAKDSIKPFKGIATEMEVDTLYERGIGICVHHNIGWNGKDLT